MERREFLLQLLNIPTIDYAIDRLGNRNTKELQVLMIKALWELSQKLSTYMYLYIPFGHYYEDNWYSTKKIKVNFVNDEYVLLTNDADLPEIGEMFPWIVANMVKFDKIPEYMNFWGELCPFFELLRLELPEFKFKLEESPE